MIGNQEEDEFVAVRVQDPRVQNEGSWNSFVDYKIFLHTNSKAFTAKTSCVRRRYSEFSWLKKRLQKNTGLVPVPELPSKSFFSFSNEDFLEGRRKGLQVFLDKVVKMTVCLSDSQLHLFLQTQLPVGHILDCVQGHTPYSVTDAILTYASSNRGFAQAQEEEAAKEPSLTVSYESMESPAPHQPCLQTKETDSPELLPCDDPVTEEIWDHDDDDTVELNHEGKSTVTVHQKKNRLEAVVEVCGPEETSFFLGDNPNDKPGSLSCLIQTPVEVHSPMGAGFEEESFLALDTGDQTVVYLDTEDNEETLMEASGGNFEPKKCVSAVDILDFKDSDTGSQEDARAENQVLENVLATEEQTVDQIAEEEKNEEESSGEASMENVEPETRATSVSNSDFKDTGVLGDAAHAENHVISEVNGLEQIGQTEGHVEDVGRPEELRNSEGLKESVNEKFDKSGSKEDTPVESEIHKEEEEVVNDVTILQMTPELVEQGTVDLVENGGCPIEFKNFGEQIEKELDNEKCDVLESKEEATLVGSESHEEEEVCDVTVESMTQELVEQEVDLVEDVASPKEFTDFDGQEKDLDNEKCDESKSKVATPVESEIHKEEEEVEECNDIVEQMNQEQVEQDVDLVEDVASPEEFTDLDTQKKKDLDIDSEKCDESESKNETATESEIHEEEVEECNDVVEQINQERVERDVGLIGTKDESGDEDRQSLHSSNESIVKVSDEESLADETEDLNGYVKTSPDQLDLEASSINILDLHINGCAEEKESGISVQEEEEEEDIRYITDIADLDNSLELNTAVTAGDLTENSDFSILEVSCTP